ncbi:B12-binding domain-containing radical SAM protein, partial [Candidatus Parcubacteria bacterium]|nr:B12-binding domain-containing radical SAM protein [Candidatus Parcubacteria bacterium]
NEMDIGIIGEGETTIVELFKLYLKTGKFERGGLRNINGIVFREKGKIVLTPKRKPILPLDKIPLPARDLMTIGKTTAMLTSRGCPYRCTFCASSRFWNKVRFFSARYVVQEIKHLFENYQVNHISFWDDLFVADRERLKKIYTLLKKEGLLGQLSFSGSVRSNLVDEELAQLLSKMNFQGVTMGLESASPPVLKYLKGSTINVDQHTRALRILNRHGIKPSASFIIGSPHETRAEILQTLKFIKKSPLHSFDTYVLTPLPGTPVWEHAKEKGLVGQNMDWSTLDVDFTQNHKKAVILSEKLTRRELYRLFKKFKREQKRRLIVYALKNSQKIPKYLAGAMRRKLHGHLSRVRRSALP